MKLNLAFKTAIYKGKRSKSLLDLTPLGSRQTCLEKTKSPMVFCFNNCSDLNVKKSSVIVSFPDLKTPDFFFHNDSWYFVKKVVLTYCEKKLFKCLRKT